VLIGVADKITCKMQLRVVLQFHAIIVSTTAILLAMLANIQM
jgi:hypothetical protein